MRRLHGLAAGFGRRVFALLGSAQGDRTTAPTLPETTTFDGVKLSFDGLRTYFY